MESLFSIDLIICTYNNAVLLNQTLAAISRLKVPVHIDCEVLVVNNNSTDETPFIIRQYINQKSIPVKTVIETKQGLTTARYCGVKNTRRPWIAFIDDDCILAENWMEEAEKFIKAHPSCGLFGSRIRLVFEKEPPKYVRNFPYAYAGKNHGDSAKRINAVAGVGMVVLRGALESSGWINNQLLADRTGNQLTSGGDIEIALRVGASFEVWYNPSCIIDHIIPERRTTKKYLQRMLFGLAASRHNVMALSWHGHYLTWLLFSIFYSLGMLGMCVLNALQELFGQRKRAGFKIAFSPFFGWNAAIRTMLVMEPEKRKKILGCVKRKK